VLEQVLGWAGVVLYIVAHGWISILKRSPKQGYYIVNLSAALLIVASSIMLASWQPVFINGFWALISIAALARFQLPSLLLTNRYLALLVAAVFCVGIAGLLVWGNVGLYILAWSSVIAFCLSYWRFSAQQLSQQGYFLFTAYAAFILLPQLYLDENWPVFLMEVLWGSLSVAGYLRHRSVKQA
jgi:hypothetical protein